MYWLIEQNSGLVTKLNMQKLKNFELFHWLSAIDRHNQEPIKIKEKSSLPIFMIQSRLSVRLQTTTMIYHLINMNNLHSVKIIIGLFELVRAVQRQARQFLLCFLFIIVAK